MIAHFGTLLRQSREKVGYWVQSKQIKPSQADAKLKELLAQIIYQSPFGLKALRELAVHLDVMSRPDEGIPIQYLSKEDKELCIRLGLLTPEGDKKPISEIPEELLRTEVPELGSARGAAVEAPEGTAEEVAP